MAHRNPAYANYSPFQRNVLDGLEGAANGDAVVLFEAQEIFLRLLPRGAAERAALEWAEHIGPVLSFILPSAAALHGVTETAELRAFFMTRQINRHV